MSKRKAIAVVATSVALALGVGPVAADVAELSTGQGDVMTFEYEGEQLRINTGNSQQSYMLVRDGRLYVVSQSDGQTMVIEMSGALKSLGQSANSATPRSVDSKVISLRKTGKTETIAGMRGETYELRYVDHEGRERQADMVLSDDPLAVGFRDAMHRMAMAMANSLGRDTFEKELEAGEQLQGQLQALNMGVLRYDKDMQIRSIKDVRVDPQRFVLPAEPVDLGGIGGIFGGQQGQSGSGGLGGWFGGGKKESSGDSESSEDDKQEDSGSATESVGKALGKTLGKIFGN